MANILVIDDEPYLVQMIKELLTFEGFEVYTANNGKEGFEQAIAVTPDMILCDVSMPVCDGFTLLEAIRQDEELAPVPFVFLTGHTDRATMRQGMEMGADDYITKPFTHEELVSAVRTRLDRARKLADFQQPEDPALPPMFHILPHELNTPLQKILGFSDILREDYDSLQPQEASELAEMIHRSALRLQRLTNNFLLLAQIQMVASDPVKSKTMRQTTLEQVREVITDAAQITTLANSRRGDLQIDVAQSTLIATDNNLRKLVEELVDNACKFSPKGTPIVVTGECEAGEYRLAVADSGRGMTPNEIAQIGAFKQFDRELYEQQGMGIGLTIAVDLADLHGGSIRIASEPERGTRVSVLLKQADHA